MALSLLFGNRYAKGKVGSVELEVTLREDHNFNSRVTEFPVEDGFSLSDHIINEPVRIVLEGIVSDTPLNIFSTFNRSIDSFNKLIEIHEERQPISVVTGLKVYPSMAITSLQIPRDMRTGQSLTFTIELQQIILDDSIRVIVDQQNLFGGVQSKIPRETVSSGENIPFIQRDPVDSLKDQATTGTDFGIQQLQPIPDNVLTKVNESLAIIEGTA